MKRLTTLLFALVLPIAALYAQPGPAELADQIIEQTNKNLEQIETMTLTTETFSMTSTTRLVKSSQDGISTLQVAESDENSPNMPNTAFGGEMYEMIRGAGSISEEVVGGYDTWRVLIDDPELLNDAAVEGINMNGNIQETRSVILWFDREELILRKIRFESVNSEENEISGDITMLDYQTHSGLPVAHTMVLRIEGMENMMSEEEMQQAREQMAQFEAQMEQMENLPESMRTMLEEQVRPQMEAMQRMMSGSGNDAISIRVLDVQVNP